MVKLILTALAVLFSFASLSQAQQSVIISEFLADNSGGLTDEDGDSPDWIELYNSGTTLVNLAGWYLTDDTTAAGHLERDHGRYVASGGGEEGWAEEDAARRDRFRSDRRRQEGSLPGSANGHRQDLRAPRRTRG